MADSAGNIDYYTVLKVHPSADQEIIEAAYRQLMKKHHPDVAGMDPRLAEEFHQRAKIINQAHSVLRDPAQRQRYDLIRSRGGSKVAAPPHPPPRSQDPKPASDGAAVSEGPPTYQEASAWTPDDESLDGSVIRSPFAALAAAYYLLPGRYEWERGHRQELLTTCLLPPVGIAAFALATGRLAPWVGTSLVQTVLAWGILGILVLPSWSSLPRLAMASVPSLVLMIGSVDAVLRQTGVPAWLAWVLFGLISLALSARLYLFAVLPTLAVCWLLSRLG